MHKGRLEAFSDGVFAILITIMVLELKVPHGDQFKDLFELWPVFLSYVLSFIYLGIYWNNHHHLLQAVHQVRGSVLWANSHLLFWLSLLSFATAWAGENHFTHWPMALYGFVLMMCGIAYGILTKILVETHGPDSVLAKAIRSDRKGKLSVIAYIVGICASFCFPLGAGLIYISVSLFWLIPDTRIENKVAN